jgi:SAM-dependent methyltransferase
MTTQAKKDAPSDIRTVVRQRYGSIAANTQPGSPADCGCAPNQTSCCGSDSEAQLSTVAHLYEDPDAITLPTDVTDLSLGCGDPVTLASLLEGQIVLDLGSGGGIDCFLAAKKVGPSGLVIGVDMTAEMIEKARQNKAKLGVENVEFRLGEIEHLPVPDSSVDVIISNCVINLSPDKTQVLSEAYRVLKPGGKLAVSDIVTDGPLPDVVKKDLSAWAGCIAGAMDQEDFTAALESVGFVDVELTPVYMDRSQMEGFVDDLDLGRDLEGEGPNLIIREGGDTMVIELEDGQEFDESTLLKTVFSAKITAYKPN